MATACRVQDAARRKKEETSITTLSCDEVFAEYLRDSANHCPPEQLKLVLTHVLLYHACLNELGYQKLEALGHVLIFDPAEAFSEDQLAKIPPFCSE